MPLDLAVIKRDACKVTQRRRIKSGDRTFRVMSEAWSIALRDGFAKIVIWPWAVVSVFRGEGWLGR